MSRGVFFDEDAARAVAARLGRDGFDVRLSRERYAGEDDDEDHPWALHTDAPEVMLELLVEEYDGWLDHDEPPHLRASPVELPGAPRRTHRPSGPDT